MRVIIVVVLSLALLFVEGWPSVKNPFEKYHSKVIATRLTDCMYVAMKEGDYYYEKTARRLNEPEESEDVLKSAMNVCGLYVVTDPDKLVEITINKMDVNCDAGGLMGFIDGWELNGQYFPGIEDHPLKLFDRVTEFCDDHLHWPTMKLHRIFRSTQNAALLQYRIPIRGSFMATVKFLPNPEPCNILATDHAPFYSLKVSQQNRNCSLTALYPAVVSVAALKVGTTKDTVNYACDHGISRLEIGGVEGLDSHFMKPAVYVCGYSTDPGPEQAIFCGTTVIRLIGHRKTDSKALVTVRPAKEDDIDIATMLCDI